MQSEKTYSRIIFALLATLWLLFFCYFFLSLFKPLYQDEGVFLAIGKGIAEGKLPYLHFWDHKTPGIYFLWAMLFGLFSTKIIFYKLFIWGINFLSAILVFGLSERIKKRSGKFSSIMFLLAIVFFEGNYLIAGPFLALFLLFSVWFLLLFPKRKISFFISGASLALAILFKQTAILNFVPLLIFVLFSKEIKKIALFLSGIFLPILGLFVYIDLNKLSSLFINQVFKSGRNYPAESLWAVLTDWGENFRRVWWLWFGVVASFFDQRIRNKNFMLILGMAFFPIIGFFVRHYPHYWLQVLPFLAILSGVGIYNVFNNSYFRKHNYLLAIIVLIIVFSVWQNFLWFRWVTKNLNIPKQNEEQEIAKVLKELPQKNLVAENRFAGYFFLANKNYPVPYLYLTEVNESESARVKTLEEIKNAKDLIVVWPKNQEHVYAKEIGRWVEQNYLRVKEFPELDLVIYVSN